MGKRQTFTQSDITRAIKGAKAAGMAVNRCEILPDGRIVVAEESALQPEDPFLAWKSARENRTQRAS